MLADDLAFVVGVDTHAETHSLAVVDAVSQRTCCQAVIAADRRGYRQALRLARRHAPGRRSWALEGSGCYGAGLARFLVERGEQVLELERPARQGSRGRGKSDALDAERAARQLLAGSAGAAPRIAAQTQALRALLVTREGAVVSAAAALNQLRALLVTAPPELRERLQLRGEAKLLNACSKLRAGADPERSAYTLALRSLASRIRQLRAEQKTLERELTNRVRTLAPTLLARRGVGPITAATLLVTWSAPKRVHSEAAFARLTGTAPIPASSGKTIRYRLDRGGDRRANHAIHMIALTLRRTDPTTQTYINRRQSEGKTAAEATRSLKRYLARSLYRQLEHETTMT